MYLLVLSISLAGAVSPITNIHAALEIFTLLRVF